MNVGGGLNGLVASHLTPTARHLRRHLPVAFSVPQTGSSVCVKHLQCVDPNDKPKLFYDGRSAEEWQGGRAQRRRAKGKGRDLVASPPIKTAAVCLLFPETIYH